MSDPGFREIHLSCKHVVFLFMAGAVAAVAIFLLGVSVGKGVTKADTASTSAAPIGTPADLGASAAPPDAAKPTPGELKAFQTLQDKSTTAPASTPTPTPADTPSPTPSPSPKSSAEPAPAKPAAAKADPPPATGAYYVVVNSFASRTNANNEVAGLKKKGHSNAAVFAVSGSKTPYKVRIGPLSDLDAATAMKARLEKEGYKPSITR
jgi:cell division septation protein DedD